MKRGQFISIVIIGVILLVVWLGVDTENNSSNHATTQLLAGVSADSLKVVTIEKDDQQIRLEYSKTGWVVPERNNYSADANKVRSLLLKLFDLGSNQLLPSQPDAFDKLGIADDSVSKGYTRIRVFEDAQSPIAGVLLGKTREVSQGASTGQYVRREGSEDVVLVGSPIAVDTDLASWLETQILTIGPGAIYKIAQYEVGANGVSTPLFVLSRGLLEDGKWGLLRVTTPDEVKSPLEESVVSQVKGALENMRLSDVQLFDEKTEYKFETETVFHLSTGVMYTINIAKDSDKYLARVAVSQPERLIEELEELNRKSATMGSAYARKRASQLKDKENGSESPNKDVEEKQEPLVTLASAAEVRELEARFAKWLYVLPEFQANKFRFKLSDLLRKEVAGATAPKT